jgi:hypothetical protein
MSSTNQIQDLFDRAIESVPSGATPSSRVLHQRLHQRSVRARLSTIGAGLLAVAMSTTALVVGLTSSSAFAVTLFPKANGSVSAAQLAADQRVMVARLHSVGFTNATVRVSNGALVVTNGPRALASPTSFLTTSPELLVRSVICYAGPQIGPVSSSPLPTSCSNSKYDAPKMSGISIPAARRDPALAVFPTTTPAQDAGSPDSRALLPVLDGGKSAPQRDLVGPTLLTLSSKVASATATEHVSSSGGWIVSVTLNKAESEMWDHVAKRYFHREIAIDLNGIIVEAPLIEPDSLTFTSFDGQMQLLAVSKTDAYDLAAALESGPLTVPLTAQMSRPRTSTALAVDVSGALRFFGAAFTSGHRSGTLSAGFIDFRSSSGALSQIKVPRSGRFAVHLAPGSYSARGRLADSNLWCSVGADKPFNIVIGKDLHLNVDCVAI